MDQHLADVRRYDAIADAETVERIVKHLGVALRNPSSVNVSCDNPPELERVCERWCMKKLGVTDKERCERTIRLVCETLSRDGSADRVTFYYLCAKHLNRLDAV